MHVTLVDLVKSFPTNIFLQKLASIQRRRNPMKFDHVTDSAVSKLYAVEVSLGERELETARRE